MRVLHLTHAENWFSQHFAYVCSLLGIEGETLVNPYFDHGQAGYPEVKAHDYFRLNPDKREYFLSFDRILTSYSPGWCKLFLRDWEKPVSVWFVDHFDNHITNTEYNKLLHEARLKPNLKFAAFCKQDKVYAQNKLGTNFPLEVLPSFFYTYGLDSRVKVPCGEDKFFLVGRNNEKIFGNQLDALKIPIYKHVWALGPPDLRGVLGIIHMTYGAGYRSLYENLAIDNVYFLPSENLLRQLWPGFWWDNHDEFLNGQWDFSHNEWYRKEYQQFFVYFSSFEELKAIANSPNLKSLIQEKKQNIRAYKRDNQEKLVQQWREFLGA
jgi:hypothetical protein